MLTFKSHPEVGRLELIIGPMFSGKSTELINRVRKHKIIESNLVIINHSLDKRYCPDKCQSNIVSHNMEREDCVSLHELLPFMKVKEYQACNVIFIEEGQFFADLYEFCLTAVERDAKLVIISGLDGDFQRKSFGQVLNLIPLADRVDKLSALCSKCRDGTPAIFSKRYAKGTEQIAVGGLDSYLPVCRKHYHVD